MKDSKKAGIGPVRDDIDRIVETLVDKPGESAIKAARAPYWRSPPVSRIEADIEDMWDNVPV